MRSGTCFMNSLWAHNQNLTKMKFCSQIYSDYTIRSQICTCHDSLAVMTCANLWLDRIIIFHTRATYVFTLFKLWVHDMLVKLCVGVISFLGDTPVCNLIPRIRGHFVYAPSQWETKLQCNTISHWPVAFTKWSLRILSGRIWTKLVYLSWSYLILSCKLWEQFYLLMSFKVNI